MLVVIIITIIIIVLIKMIKKEQKSPNVPIIRSRKRLNENEYQPILHNGHNIKHFIWIIHKGQT